MKGRGLEYLYFSVHDDDIDGNQSSLLPLNCCWIVWCVYLQMSCVCSDHTRCNAWVLDGDLYHKGLQGVAVPVDSISDTLLLITVDMSRPWNALDSLQKWAAVAREHIDKLRIAPETLRELEHRRESHWHKESGEDEERPQWHCVITHLASESPWSIHLHVVGTNTQYTICVLYI